MRTLVQFMHFCVALGLIGALDGQVNYHCVSLGFIATLGSSKFSLPRRMPDVTRDVVQRTPRAIRLTIARADLS